MKAWELVFVYVVLAFLTGCGTTFQERSAVYAAIYEKAAALVIEYGPVVADAYVADRAASGAISPEQADAIRKILAEAAKKTEAGAK